MASRNKTSGGVGTNQHQIKGSPVDRASKAAGVARAGMIDSADHMSLMLNAATSHAALMRSDAGQLGPAGPDWANFSSNLEILTGYGVRQADAWIDENHPDFDDVVADAAAACVSAEIDRLTVEIDEIEQAVAVASRQAAAAGMETLRTVVGPGNWDSTRASLIADCRRLIEQHRSDIERLERRGPSQSAVIAELPPDLRDVVNGPAMPFFKARMERACSQAAWQRN